MARRWAIIRCEIAFAVRSARTLLPQNIFRPLLSLTFTPFTKCVQFVSDPTPLSAFEDGPQHDKKVAKIVNLPSDSAIAVAGRFIGKAVFPIRKHGKLSEHHLTGAPEGGTIILFRRRGARKREKNHGRSKTVRH